MPIADRQDFSSDEGLPRISWYFDWIVVLLLVGVFFSLRPVMPDGDGLSHAGRAMMPGFLDGMVPAHPIYAPVLHGVYNIVAGLGMKRYTLEAFTLVSAIAGGMIYLILARVVFTPLLRDVLLVRFCALGVMFSYGVMQASCIIESYALALLIDVALVALCLRKDITTATWGIVAGTLFALAVGIHVTNVLLLPFLTAVLIVRLRGQSWTAAGWAVGTVMLGAAFIVLSLMLVDGRWPPSWAAIVPVAEPEPTLGVAGRVGRAIYGFARTIAWLMPARDLLKSRVFALGYAAAFVGVAGTLIAMAFYQRPHPILRRLCWPLALLAAPFVLMGIRYYPSDSERWLFLMPPLWLGVGLICNNYRLSRQGWLTSRMVGGFLFVVVVVIGLYNTCFKLLPEARYSRSLAGLHQLCDIASPKDLVVSVSGCADVTSSYVLRRPIMFEFLRVDLIVLKQHPDDPSAVGEAIRNHVQRALNNGRRVLVFGLLDEGLTPGRGYPWSFVRNSDITPDTILDVLEDFEPRVLVASGVKHPGIHVVTANASNGEK